jgi:hypothetical protein
MIRVCGFNWDNETNSLLQLRSPDEISARLELRPVRAIDSPLVFESEDDFIKNYSILFSTSLRHQILKQKPIQVGANAYEIRWSERAVNSLRFEQFEQVGYKFAGLFWEP